MNISDHEKRIMLSAVRQYLESRLTGAETEELPDLPIFSRKPGIFITLNKRKMLRGCIGHIIGQEPLSQSLYELAEASAFQDPRFPGLKHSELEDIEIEISILSEPVKIEHWQDIEPGLHGILIRKGFHQAVFLPQVATEQGWDLTTTLRHLCLKAGLNSEAYIDEDMEFRIFTATVFSEGK